MYTRGRAQGLDEPTSTCIQRPGQAATEAREHVGSPNHLTLKVEIERKAYVSNTPPPPHLSSARSEQPALESGARRRLIGVLVRYAGNGLAQGCVGGA